METTQRFIYRELVSSSLNWKQGIHTALKEEVTAKQGPWMGSRGSPHGGPPGAARSSPGPAWGRSLWLGSGFSSYHIVLYAFHALSPQYSADPQHSCSLLEGRAPLFCV